MLARFFMILATAFIGLPLAGAVLAQDIAQPAEMPPADFAGQQYVDSRGCVFLRTGVDGQIRWVQRMTADRQPLCGYPPSVQQVEGPEPAGATRATGAAAAPAKAAPSTPRRQARRSKASSRPLRLSITPICPAHAPHGKRARTIDGRVRLYCSANPNFDLAAAVQRSNARLSAEASGKAQLRAHAEMPIPKGYRRAWKDGRLNPYRGIGTAAGQSAQDRIWTREVPANLQPEPDMAKPLRSRMGAPGYTVQVGSFGIPANARATQEKFIRMGIPASVTRSGGLQVVHVGPFATAGEARQALSAARRVGFGDAFIRR
ncbi:MAG: SPOR domain-containing protein [Pseudorhodobacter sp.]